MPQEEKYQRVRYGDWDNPDYGRIFHAIFQEQAVRIAQRARRRKVIKRGKVEGQEYKRVSKPVAEASGVLRNDQSNLTFILEPTDDKYLDHVAKIGSGDYELLDFMDKDFSRNLFKALRLNKINLDQMTTALMIYDAKGFLGDTSLKRFSIDDNDSPLQLSKYIGDKSNGPSEFLLAMKGKERSFYTADFQSHETDLFFLYALQSKQYAASPGFRLLIANYHPKPKILERYLKDNKKFDDTFCEKLASYLLDRVVLSDPLNGLYFVKYLNASIHNSKVTRITAIRALEQHLVKLEKCEHSSEIQEIKDNLKLAINLLKEFDLSLEKPGPKNIEQIFQKIKEYHEKINGVFKRYEADFKSVSKFHQSMRFLISILQLQTSNPSIVPSPNCTEKEDSPVLSFLLLPIGMENALQIAKFGREAVLALPTAGLASTRMIRSLLERTAYVGDNEIDSQNDTDLLHRVFKDMYSEDGKAYSGRPVEFVHPDLKQTENPHDYDVYDFLLSWHDRFHAWRAGENFKRLIKHELALFTTKGVCQGKQFLMSKANWSLSDMDFSLGMNLRRGTEMLIKAEHNYLQNKINDFNFVLGDYFAGILTKVLGDNVNIDQSLFLLQFIDFVKHESTWNEMVKELCVDNLEKVPNFKDLMTSYLLQARRAHREVSTNINKAFSDHRMLQIIQDNKEKPVELIILMLKLREVSGAKHVCAMFDSAMLQKFFEWGRNGGLLLKKYYKGLHNYTLNAESLSLDDLEPKALLNLMCVLCLENQFSVSPKNNSLGCYDDFNDLVLEVDSVFQQINSSEIILHSKSFVDHTVLSRFVLYKLAFLKEMYDVTQSKLDGSVERSAEPSREVQLFHDIYDSLSGESNFQECLFKVDCLLILWGVLEYQNNRSRDAQLVIEGRLGKLSNITNAGGNKSSLFNVSRDYVDQVREITAAAFRGFDQGLAHG